MDLEEAYRRLLRVHWKMIAACLVVGVLVGAGKSELSHTAYQASARVVMPTPAVSSSDSESYADAARAVVTSPGQVRSALRSIGIDRNAQAVAANQVTLAALGTSSVEQLTVTDRDPRVAAALANALADRLVVAMVPQQMGSTSPDSTAAITDQIRAVDTQLTAVDEGLAHGSPASLPQLSALAQSLVAQRQSLVQQQEALLGVRMPAVLSAATVPTTPVATHRSLYAGLGLLLGAVLGVGLAALAETLSPTVASPRRVAILAGAPWLGWIHLRRRGNLVDPKLPWRLRLALPEGTERIDVVVVGPASRAALAQTIEAARALQAAIGRFRSCAEGDGAHGGPHLLAVSSVEDLPAAGEEPAGLLIIAPKIVKRRQIEDALEWAELAGEPVLGVVTGSLPSSARTQDIIQTHSTAGRGGGNAGAIPSAENGRGSKEAATSAKEAVRG